MNNKKRDHEDAVEAWIVPQEDIVARILGLSMVESKKLKKRKRMQFLPVSNNCSIKSWLHLSIPSFKLANASNYMFITFDFTKLSFQIRSGNC